MKKLTGIFLIALSILAAYQAISSMNGSKDSQVQACVRKPCR